MKNRKSFYLGFIFVLLVAWLSACGSPMGNGAQNGSGDPEHSSATRIYHSETGDIEVPANPQRIAVLAHIYVGNVLQLGIKPVAVNEWVKDNKFFEGMLDDVEVVTEDSPEKLLELNPDLIITFPTDKNLNKYSSIAPTVALDHQNLNYLEQHLEIGKIVGKEEEAQDWIDAWNEKVSAEKEKVFEAIGADATVTVMDTFGKDIYIYGKNWGRGTEIIYQAFGIKAPEKVQQDVFGPGYKAISSEVLPQYAGDYIFVGTGAADSNNSFMETDVWKGIPAVKNNNVILFDAKSFWFNDPVSLENELEFIVDELTKKR